MGQAMDSVLKDVLELVTHSVEEKLDIDKFYDKLDTLTGNEITKAMLDKALVETFWLLWIRLDGSGERRARLIELMRNCVQDKKVDRKVAMESLEVDCMHAAGLVVDSDVWRRKEVRYTTRTLYTVQKYNLLREDSEGYARLIVALNMMGDAALQPEMVKPLYREIQALIGYFDLDPNRVLDLVLDAAEVQPDNVALRQLVPLFKKDAVVHLLGFKFQHHQAAGAEPAWPRLPLLAAHLIHEGLVDLDQLLGHLAPGDDDIRKAQDAAMAELQKAVSDIGVVSLNAPTDKTADKAITEAGSSKAVITVQPPVIELPAPRAPPSHPPYGPGMGGPMGTGGIIAGIRGSQSAHGLSNLGMGMGAQSIGGSVTPYGIERGAGMGTGDRGGAYGGEDRGALAGAFKAQTGLRADQLELDPAKTYEALLLPSDAARNQKLALAQALLQVGAWDHAQALLGRLGALGVSAAAWPPISDTLCRVVKDELQPILSCLAPRGAAAQGILDAASQVMDKVGVAGGSAAFRAGLPGSCKVGPPLSERGVAALMALGPFLSRQPALLNQVIQAVRHHYLFYGLVPTPSEDGAVSQSSREASKEAARVDELLSRVLLPASCLVPSMPATSLELWQLLKLMPFTVRYRLYTDLKEQVDRHPYLSAAAKMAAWETRKVLKRLHSEPDKRQRKESCKPHGRLIAKIAAGNPVPVLEVIVAQVEAYVNQLEPIVEALKYLTPMGFDALTFVILTRLALDRPKVKEDGINISDWLQSLAKFTGAVCRKYNAVDNGVDIRALCQFLANALRGADSFDLLVLKELVETLTGISIQPELSDEQLEGKLGGEALSSYVLMLDTDRSRRQWARGARRLLEALQKGPPRAHLALPLFILVAQQRQAIMVHTNANHIKFVVELYDRCHETCQQYQEFLQAALPFEDYVRLMPSIYELRTTYKLSPETVFVAHRKLLRNLLDVLQAANPPAEEGEIEEPGEQGEQGEIDVSGGAAATLTADGGSTPSTAVAGDVVMGDASDSNPAAESTQLEDGSPTSDLVAKGADVEVVGISWQQVLAQVRASAPNSVLFEYITPYLYALFWTLTIHDIHVPNNAYEVELEKARAELRGVESQMSAARAAGPGSQLSEDDVLELGQRRERLKDLIKKMPGEQEQQAKRVDEVRAFIAREKDKMILASTLQDEGQDKGREKKDKTKMAAVVIVQECILPRVLCSPLDAFYCAKFAELLNSICLPCFSTVWYYNQLVRDIIPALRCITDHEAVNMGIFLLETFRLLNYWRSSERVYAEECSTKPGFSVKLTPPTDNKKTTYEQYKQLVSKWHDVAMSTIKACLESSEHTSRRNALSILNRMLPVFPVSRKNVDELRKSLEKVKEEEKREDLAVMLKSYIAAFTAEMNKDGRVIPTEMFAPSKKGPARKPAASRPGTPVSPGRGNGAVTRSAPPAATKPAAASGTASAPAGNGTSTPTRTNAPSRFRPDAPEFKSGQPGHASPTATIGSTVAAAPSAQAAATQAAAEGQAGAARTRAADDVADAAKTHKRVKTEPAPSDAGARANGAAAANPSTVPASAPAAAAASAATRPALKREAPAPAATGPVTQPAAAAAAEKQPASKRPRIEPPAPRVDKDKGEKDRTERDGQPDKEQAERDGRAAGKSAGNHKDKDVSVREKEVEGRGRDAAGKEGDKDRDAAGREKDREGKREGRKDLGKEAGREEGKDGGKDKDEKKEKEKRREDKKEKEDKREKRRDKDRRSSHDAREEGREDSPLPSKGEHDREDRSERQDRERRDQSRESRGDRGASRDAPSREGKEPNRDGEGVSASSGRRRHREKEHASDHNAVRDGSPDGPAAASDLRNMLSSRGSARLGDEASASGRLSRQGSELAKDMPTKPSASTGKPRRR